MKTQLYGLLFGIITTVQAQNLCTPNPCANNGACFVDPLNDEFGYICICPEGFVGQNCQEETNECDPNPCQNDGNCTDGFLTFSCECPPGFNGEECEFEINECDSNPCQNGGTCSDGISTFSCECPLGFNGCECQFALLALSFPPVLVKASATSIMTEWRAWDPNIDQGDPPVVSYIPYYREATTVEWTRGPVISSEETLELRVNNLEADTLYEFSVTAVREGENGEGSKSPSATLRTKCDVPLEKTPHDVEIILNTATKQLNVSWQSPDNVMCSSGISHYSIYYKNESRNDGVQFLTRAEADVSWVIIDITILGEGEFSFFVSLTVERESDLSSGSEKIVITEDIPEEPSSTGPSFIVIFIIIIILVIIIAVCIFLVVRYQRNRMSNSTSNNAEKAGYDNKAVA